MGNAARKSPTSAPHVRPKLVAVVGGRAKQSATFSVLGVVIRTKKARPPTKAQLKARRELLELMKSSAKR